MIWDLVLTVRLNGEPREIDWKTVETQTACEQDAADLNSKEGFSSYYGAKAFCRELPRERAHNWNPAYPTGRTFELPPKQKLR